MEFDVFVLRGHEKSSNGVVVFEMHLDPQVVTGPSELLPESFCLGYHYGNIFVVRSFIVFVVLVTSGCLSIMVVVFVVEFVV